MICWMRRLGRAEGLDGEVLAETGDAGKGLLQAVAGLTNPGLVVDVKRGAVVFGDLFYDRKESVLERFGHGHGAGLLR